jgi:hypothetical protein
VRDLELFLLVQGDPGRLLGVVSKIRTRSASLRSVEVLMSFVLLL